MPFRLVVLAAVVTLMLVPAAASGQNGQGANVNPAATPPVRPASLIPTTPPRPVLILQTEPGRMVDANLFGGITLLRFGQVAAAAQSPAEPVLTPGNGVTAPRVIVQVNPAYTSAAMQHKIEGAVVLEAVVQTDGRLQEIKLIKSLDKQYGLDQAALDAATKWLFEPGTKDGKPVNVRVTVEMRFAIDSKSNRPGSSESLIIPPTAPPATNQISDEEFLKGAHKATEAGITSPKVKETVEATYTPAAMQAKIQGVVRVEMVVLEDGTVARARVVESLDKTFGLDENALAAALKTKFEPGTLNGHPVPVVATMTLEFRLH